MIRILNCFVRGFSPQVAAWIRPGGLTMAHLSLQLAKLAYHYSNARLVELQDMLMIYGHISLSRDRSKEVKRLFEEKCVCNSE